MYLDNRLSIYRFSVSCLAILIACFALPAHAASTPGGAEFEISVGGYTSGYSGLVGDEAALGIRGGYRFNDRWGIQGSLSRVEITDLFLIFDELDGDATFLDVSARYFVNPRRKAEVFFYGGIGFASFDVRAEPGFLPNPFGGRPFRRNEAVEASDELTTHLGVGVNIRLGERMYLRPDIKVRWINADDGDPDTESTLGLGWRW